MTISTVSMSELLNFLPFWKIEHFLKLFEFIKFSLANSDDHNVRLSRKGLKTNCMISCKRQMQAEDEK